MTSPLSCSECGKVINPKGLKSYLYKRKFCDKVCGAAFSKRSYREIAGEPLNLPGSTVGALHELLVSYELLKRGYQVFRALAPNALCDLMVIDNKGVLKRLEVTSGHYAKNGKINHPPKDRTRFDVLCVVTRDNKIHFDPDLRVLRETSEGLSLV